MYAYLLKPFKTFSKVYVEQIHFTYLHLHLSKQYHCDTFLYYGKNDAKWLPDTDSKCKHVLALKSSLYVMCTALQMLLQELPQKSFEMFEMTKLLGLYSLNYLDKTFRYFGSFKENRENLFLKPLKNFPKYTQSKSSSKQIVKGCFNSVSKCIHAQCTSQVDGFKGL